MFSFLEDYFVLFGIFHTQHFNPFIEAKNKLKTDDSDNFANVRKKKTCGCPTYANLSLYYFWPYGSMGILHFFSNLYDINVDNGLT